MKNSAEAGCNSSSPIPRASGADKKAHLFSGGYPGEIAWAPRGGICAASLSRLAISSVARREPEGSLYHYVAQRGPNDLLCRVPHSFSDFE